jgi:fructose-specific phosphotransferase system component IIB
MAAYACGALGTSDARVQLETRARTTWENVLLTLPMVESADRIVIASDRKIQLNEGSAR